MKKAEGKEGEYIISCRTWKVLFHIEQEKKQILVKDLFSNYKREELLPESPDKYGDKDFHRVFLEAFPSL